MPDDRIPEVRVWGRRIVPEFLPWFHREGGYEEDRDFDEGGGGGSGGLTAAGAAAAVARPITTPSAPRVPNLRLVISNPPPPNPLGGILQRLGVATAIATVLGWTAREILDELGEQLLEEEYRELMSISPPLRRDSPLYLEPPPAPIPEVTVLASRADQLRAALVVPPQPEFFPNLEPITVPAPTPSTAPAPAPVVQPVTQPAPAPAPPLPAPLATPRPDLNPLGNPFQFPQGSPRRQPRPGTDRNVQRLTGSNVQGLGSIDIPGFSTDAMPQLATNPETARRRCPPCKKEKEERRNRCYKKMVYERAYARWDDVYEWAEIDCETGVEL